MNAEARLQEIRELCESWLYEGRCVNATDEQLMRDELARELLDILDAA